MTSPIHVYVSGSPDDPRARALGLLDPVALNAARSRVEWRPSLPVVDLLIEEFAPDLAA
jgi:hypothetical protein